MSKKIKIKIKDIKASKNKITSKNKIASKAKVNNDFMFYPLLTDPDFNKNIFLKKEFNDFKTHQETKTMDELCKPTDFKLDANQNFLRNYINPDTPYNGILLVHGTGVGKTCASISMAEGFKEDLKKINKKILVITVLKNNFKKELFDFSKDLSKKRPEQIVQCTGKSYELPDEFKHYSIKQKKIYVDRLINNYYQLFGYQEFANYIIKNTNWKGEEDLIDDRILKYISKEFDDRVIIIDEVHNIKIDRNNDLKKTVQPILRSIIKYAKNTKLILMSATPMFDIPQEIIYIVNLLLLNDDREEIKVHTFFNKDGTLKPDADIKLKELMTGYISYIRPEPLKFPIRIYSQKSTIPKISYTITNEKIKSTNLLKYTPLIECSMCDIQLLTYQYYINKIIKKNKNNIDKFEYDIDETDELENIDEFDELDDINNSNNSNNNMKNNNNEIAGIRTLKILESISNIVFPLDHGKLILNSPNKNKNISKMIGAFGRNGINNDTDNGLGGFYKNIQYSISSGRKTIKYKYQSHAIFNKGTKNEKPFMDYSLIKNYSCKMFNLLENIKNTTGLIFIYSTYKDIGTIPISLMLEQNGYSRYTVEGETNLLDYSPNKVGGGGVKKKICYLCSKEANDINHIDTESNNYHVFKVAKYLLYFGSNQDIIKIRKEDALSKFSSSNNKYGEEIKIFIGTKTVSEGLDFKRIRQIHILEPWYNLSRLEQIIGRGIRRCSHIDLPKEERNVEIFQYATSYPKDDPLSITETIDMRNYRKSELKDVRIKNIIRLMKESAVDCNLFHDTNVFITNKKVKQITASNEVKEILMRDEPYSQICDYKENCNYKCNWMHDKNKKYNINTDTYNIRFAKFDIEKYKNKIKMLFRLNNIYHLELIEQLIKAEDKDNYNSLFLYNALHELLNNKNEVVFDKFNRRGYIMYKGDYYIFQPNEFEFKNLPIHYRLIPNNKNIDSVPLDIINVKYNTNSISKNSISKIIINDLKQMYKNIINKIEEQIELHKYIYINDNSKYLNQYINAVFGLIIDKLTFDNKFNFISLLLNEYNNNDNLEKIKMLLLDYLDEILLRKYDKVFIEFKSKSISKSPNKNNDKNIYVGFFLNKKYYCLNNFINNNNEIDASLLYSLCSDEIIYKIEKYKKLIKKSINKISINKSLNYNIIYGKVDLDKNKHKYLFKIIDKTKENIILTQEQKVSQRSIVYGRECSTFNILKLMEIREVLGMYKFSDKKKRDFICNDIEIFLRYKQNLEKGDKIWFITA